MNGIPRFGTRPIKRRHVREYATAECPFELTLTYAAQQEQRIKAHAAEAAQHEADLHKTDMTLDELEKVK